MMMTSRRSLEELGQIAADDARLWLDRGDWITLTVDPRQPDHPIRLDHGRWTPTSSRERSIETVQYHWTGYRVKTVHP